MTIPGLAAHHQIYAQKRVARNSKPTTTTTTQSKDLCCQACREELASRLVASQVDSFQPATWEWDLRTALRVTTTTSSSLRKKKSIETKGVLRNKISPPGGRSCQVCFESISKGSWGALFGRTRFFISFNGFGKQKPRIPVRDWWILWRGSLFFWENNDLQYWWKRTPMERCSRFCSKATQNPIRLFFEICIFLFFFAHYLGCNLFLSWAS